MHWWIWWWMERSSIPTLVSVKTSTGRSFPWWKRRTPRWRTPRWSDPRNIIYLFPIVTQGSCRIPIYHGRATNRRQRRGIWKRRSIMKLRRRWSIVEGRWRQTTTCMVTEVAPPTKVTPTTSSVALH